MQRALPLVPTILLQLELLGHGFLVLGRRIVPTFALGALERDDFSSCARHDFSWMFVEPSMRFELMTPSLPRTCSTPELRGRFGRIWSGRRDSNPRPTAWKAVTLPTELLPLASETVKNGGEWRIRTFVGQSPADLQSAAFDRSAISPRICDGAGDGTRTRDLLITNQLLYQLSYASIR